MAFPKIELHVHLEGTVRPETLLEIARRNDYALPCTTVQELRALYEFRDFAHFIEVWILTTNALRTSEDFRQVVVDYAAEAAHHGAVYIEGIFSPSERVRRGGLEAEFPPEPYAPVFALARDEGFASVPHAGEVAGAASVRGALDALGADRIRHGIRAVDDAGLVRELAARQLVLDVCPISNIRTRAVASLAEHPLPRLIAEGVPCSISTDDPAMFDTDLTKDYDAARILGVEPRACYEAGLRGALCDEQTKSRLRGIGAATDWAATTATLVTMGTDEPHGTG